MKKYTKGFGDYGESISIEYLENKNYSILSKNFFCSFGELDIIVKDRKFIIFVEVKTRSCKSFGSPSEAITTYKKNRIIKSANYYLHKYNLFDNFIRFDVIEISVNIDEDSYTLNHYENAFYI